MLKLKQLLILCLLILVQYSISIPPLLADIINVPRDAETIQEAIDIAGALDTVLVRPGRYTENIVFGGQLILLTSLFMLEGDEQYIESTIIDGGGESACIAFTDGEGEDAIVSGFTITNGWQNFGGGIDCQQDSRPILENLIVTGNEAAQIGGGIYCTWNSTPIIRNVIVENNTANDGAGIGLAHECHPIISDVIIRNNEAESFGGGVFAGHGDGEGTFQNVTITNNTAPRGGGAGIEWTQNVNFNDVVFDGNTSTDGSGVIYSSFAEFSMLRSEITGSEGDAIGSRESTMVIDSCNIAGNTGGAIYADESIINISHTIMDQNFSGIIAGYSELTMNMCEITASDSLAISVFDSSVVLIDSSEITENDDLGLVSDSSIVAISTTIFNNNRYGIFASDSDLNLMLCEVSNSDSFGISVEDSSTVRIDSTVILRNAGGGIFIDSCIVSLTVTNINENMLGLFASDSDLGLMHCEVSENDSFGISLVDSSIAIIESSFIVNQGEDDLSNGVAGLLIELSSLDLFNTLVEGNEHGIICRNADMIIHGCEVVGNWEFGLWLLDTSDVHIDSSTFNNNSYGIDAQFSIIVASQTEINENRFGIGIGNSELDMSQSDISRNVDYGGNFRESTVNLLLCTVNDNRGGGLLFSGSMLNIGECIIRGNHRESSGGGLLIASTNAQIYNSLIVDNTAEENAAAIYSNSSDITLVNNTIINNSSEGVGGANYGTGNSKLNFVNNILWGNQPQSIAIGMRQEQELPDTVMVAFSDIQGGIDSVAGDGEIIWLDGNIDADPLFAELDSLGHSFLPDSPCIDAGTAFFVYQGDTLVNLTEDDYLDDAPDMGAFERDHTDIDDEMEEIPEVYSLISTYPNPFNSSLTVNINLKAPGLTLLAVFDLQGREVAVLNDKLLPAGKSNFAWDAKDYSQGIYFVRLETADFEVHKKVVYLK